MRKLLLVCVSVVMLLSLSSGTPAETALRDLETLVNEIEANHKSYTKDDWKNVSASYSTIEKELDKYEYSSDDIKKIGVLKGKYVGYYTKQSVGDVGTQIKNSAKELKGGIKGFWKAISDDGDNKDTDTDKDKE